MIQVSSGKQLTLNDQSYTVVGITPPDFQYGLEADVTVPFGLSGSNASVGAAQTRN